MKKVLVNPNGAKAQYISSWVEGDNPEPVFSDVENSVILHDVVDPGQEFEVAAPLVWVDADDSVVDGTKYYDTQSKTIKSLPADATPPANFVLPTVE